MKFKIMRIGWTNAPLLLASVVLLVSAWFVPLDRDPGGQGSVMLSMILMIRALAMPQSKWITLIGCTLAGLALLGNASLLPKGGWQAPVIMFIGILCIPVLFWQRLSKPSVKKPKDTPSHT